MIGERLSQDYIILNLLDTLGVARAKLDENPGFEAIIFDEQEQPVTIVASEDLVKIDANDNLSLADFAGQLPPGVVTNINLSMEDFVLSPSYIMFSLGARGVIVFDEDRLSGVVTASTVNQYLLNEFELNSELKGIPSDTQLAGEIVNKPIIMFCDAYNHRNELAYYNRHKPPQCQSQTPHPHLIRQK